MLVDRLAERTFKRFRCDRCGYQFVKKLASLATRCPKCFRGLKCLDFDNYVRHLDPYSRMKVGWVMNEKEWADNIRRRQIVGDKVYLNDSSGHRLGEMPTADERVK